MTEDDVREASNRFIRAALSYISQASKLDPVPVLARQRVEFEGPGRLSAPFEQEIGWVVFLANHRDALSASDETKRLLALLIEEGTLHLPRVIDAAGQSITPTGDLLERLAYERIELMLREYLNQSGTSLRFEASRFETVFLDFRALFHSRAVVHELVIPLLFFDCGAANIDLQGGLSLVPLTPADQSRLFPPDPFGAAHVSAHELASARYAIRATYVNESPIDAGGAEFHQEAELVVTALRILKPGDVFPAAIYHRVIPAFTGTSRGSTLSGSWRPLPQSPRPYVLRADDIPAVLNLLGALRRLQSSRRYQPLEIAISRFEQTYRRESAEDEIIDLAIGLESSILFGLSDELRYRLALRGACLLAKRTAPQRSVALLRTLYDVRSKLVHEGRSIQSQVKNGQIGGMIPTDFVAQIFSWYRGMLAELIERLETGISLSALVLSLDDAIVAALANTATERPRGPVTSASN